MYERDQELLSDAVAAVYSSDLAAAVAALDCLRKVAHSESLRELVASARSRAQPVRAAVPINDPNPLTLPVPGSKPGDLGLPQREAA